MHGWEFGGNLVNICMKAYRQLGNMNSMQSGCRAFDCLLWEFGKNWVHLCMDAYIHAERHEFDAGLSVS